MTQHTVYLLCMSCRNRSQHHDFYFMHAEAFHGVPLLSLHRIPLPLAFDVASLDR